MKVLLMRHGIAAEREVWRGADANRPLTPAGIQKTQAAVRGLKQLEPHLDLIASSPLLRAQQTAAIGSRFYGAQVEVWPELEDANFDALMARLRHQSTLKTVLLVGHEPGLSHFAARLLSGRSDGLTMPFKKAGVCALEIGWTTEISASLQWFAPPRLLRALHETQF